ERLGGTRGALRFFGSRPSPAGSRRRFSPRERCPASRLTLLRAQLTPPSAEVVRAHAPLGARESGTARSVEAFAVSRRRACAIVPRPHDTEDDMDRHVVPTRWKSGMIEIGSKVFAYVQASGVDPRGDTGVANSGLIVGAEAAVAVDALMVPSMTRRLVAAIKKTTRKPVAQLINTHHHLDHTGGNRFFRDATIVASEKCREALAPGLPPVPMLKAFMPRFAAEFPKLKVV